MTTQQVQNQAAANYHYDNSQCSFLDGTQGASGALGADAMPLGMMTCDELLAWLQVKLSGMSDRVRGKMNIGNMNADAQDKLNKASQELCNCRNGQGDAKTAADAIRSALAAHGTDGTIPADLKGKLEKILDRLDAMTAQKASEGKWAEGFGPNDPLAHIFARQIQSKVTIAGEQYDDVVNSISNQNAALEKVGTMNLTELNQLVSQMSQATGMVSSMMASFNDSAKGIISNMRG